MQHPRHLLLLLLLSEPDLVQSNLALLCQCQHHECCRCCCGDLRSAALQQPQQLRHAPTLHSLRHQQAFAHRHTSGAAAVKARQQLCVGAAAFPVARATAAWIDRWHHWPFPGQRRSGQGQENLFLKVWVMAAGGQ